MSLKVPIIDISPLHKANVGNEAVFIEISKACETWGFFYIKNHHIDPLLVKQVLTQAKEFFSLDKKEKDKVARFEGNFQGFSDSELTKQKKDWKEIFDFSCETSFTKKQHVSDIHGKNQWPDDNTLPHFKKTMTKYFQEMRELSLLLMKAVFHSLHKNVNVEDFMKQCFEGSEDTSFARLNFYPVYSFNYKDQLGVGPHSDAGVLTVLYQEEGVSSLQVKKEGVWYDVPPIKDTFVVNIGDMTQVWSNGRYLAPVHRVLANKTESRFSLPFFLNPAYTCVVQPVEDGKETPQYRPICWNDFRRRRVLGDYYDLGEELQISHYHL